MSKWSDTIIARQIIGAVNSYRDFGLSTIFILDNKARFSFNTILDLVDVCEDHKDVSIKTALDVWLSNQNAEERDAIKAEYATAYALVKGTYFYFHV